MRERVDGFPGPGFNRLRALSSWAGDPSAAARPFDAARCGFVLGEGAAILVLEASEVAGARGAACYAEVRGCGLSGDAHHATSPRPGGAGAAAAMAAALAGSHLGAADVDYVNAHAAGTPTGDAAEAAALEAVFGGRPDGGPLVSSTKGATGHLLGAAGALEALVTVLALRDGVAPGTRNLDAPLDAPIRVLADAEDRDLRVALSNSFGFGGTNVALLFSTPPEDLVSRRPPVPRS